MRSHRPVLEEAMDKFRLDYSHPSFSPSM